MYNLEYLQVLIKNQSHGKINKVINDEIEKDRIAMLLLDLSLINNPDNKFE
jgi:hypothetical protein